MFGLIEGTGGGGGEGQGFNFNVWASKNELDDNLQRLFQKHGATSPDTMTLTSPQIHALMAELGQSQPHLIGTVLSAINDIGSAKIKKIVISEEEQMVIDSITENLKTLDQTQHELLELKQSYPESVTRIKQDKLTKIEAARVKVNDTFDALCGRLQQQKHQILEQIDHIQSEMDVKSDKDGDDDEKEPLSDENSWKWSCGRTLSNSKQFLKEQQKQYEDLTSTNEDRLKRKNNVIELGKETERVFAESKKQIDDDLAAIKNEIQNNRDTLVDIDVLVDEKKYELLLNRIDNFGSIRNETYAAHK